MNHRWNAAPADVRRVGDGVYEVIGVGVHGEPMAKPARHMCITRTLKIAGQDRPVFGETLRDLRDEASAADIRFRSPEKQE